MTIFENLCVLKVSCQYVSIWDLLPVPGVVQVQYLCKLLSLLRRLDFFSVDHYHSDPDLDPDPTFHFDTNPEPDPDPDLDSAGSSEMLENLNYLNFYFQQCQSTHFSSASYASFFQYFGQYIEILRKSSVEF